MKVKFYEWECEKHHPTEFVRFGVSDMGSVVATWFCMQCQSVIVATLTLQKVIGDIPSSPPEFTKEDEDLLRKAHIILDRKEPP